ncbi:hypothetical protein HY628_02705, partial [Candidatus Uhrbacteria bacterium]|nr:hypothetical protein [Candidatus Uhrbacteria bacterium]
MTRRQWKKRLTAAAVTIGGAALLLAPSAFALTLNQLGVQEVEKTIQLGNRDIRETVASIINVLMGLLGIIAVVIVLI